MQTKLISPRANQIRQIAKLRITGYKHFEQNVRLEHREFFNFCFIMVLVALTNTTYYIYVYITLNAGIIAVN